MPRKTTVARTSRKAKKETSPTEVVAEVVEEQQAVEESIEVVESAPMETGNVEETSPDQPEMVDSVPEPEPIAEEVAPEPVVEKPKTRKRAPRKKKEPITQEVEQSIPVEVIPAPQEVPVEEPKVDEPAPKRRGGRKKAVKNVVTQARSRFGLCEINGIRHEHDLIMKADGTVERRDKSLSKDKKDKYGHVPLTRKELKTLLDDNVKLVFIGTGQSGGMPITPKASKMLEEMHAVVKPTPDVIEEMLAAKEKFVALIHVTC
jgi:hypothetical protein